MCKKVQLFQFMCRENDYRVQEMIKYEQRDPPPSTHTSMRMPIIKEVNWTPATIKLEPAPPMDEEDMLEFYDEVTIEGEEEQFESSSKPFCKFISLNVTKAAEPAPPGPIKSPPTKASPAVSLKPLPPAPKRESLAVLPIGRCRRSKKVDPVDEEEDDNEGDEEGDEEGKLVNLNGPIKCPLCPKKFSDRGHHEFAQHFYALHKPEVSTIKPSPVLLLGNI